MARLELKRGTLSGESLQRLRAFALARRPIDLTDSGEATPVDTDDDTPVERPIRVVSFSAPSEADPWTPGEVAWAALGAACLGLAAGYVLRKLREERAHKGAEDKPRNVVALGLTRGYVRSVL